MDLENKEEVEMLCRNFHAHLRILYWEALQECEKEKMQPSEEHEKKIEELQNKMKHYQEAYKKVEMLQERRHLTQVGEKGGYREAYQTMLKIIDNKYHPEYSYTNLKIVDGRYIPDGQYSSPYVHECVEEIIQEIDELCKNYGIEMNTKGKEQER